MPGFLTAQSLHSAYSLPNETTPSAAQTVAVVDAFDDPTAESDLAVYDEQFGLPPCTSANGCFRKVNEHGNASPLPQKQGEWDTEISIDVQMAHAICQNCHVLLVEASSEEFSDLSTAVDTAASAGASEISNSYGATEVAGDNADAPGYDHPGVVVTVSSGDCGYLNESCRRDPVGANFPADSPNVVAVGGTTLKEHAGAWTSTAWGEGGSGCSSMFSAALWQSELADFSATGCASARSVADVAAIGNPQTGVDVYDSTPDGRGDPTGWGVWGGTSVSSPIVASEFALAGGSHGVAHAAATLYGHFGESDALYDVVSGSNGSCGITSECKAGAGYDGPTGVGSPVGLGAFSLPGTPVELAPLTISGTVEQGETLTEAHAEWSIEPSSYSYQWERCNSTGLACQPIASANLQTYSLTTADISSTLRVQEIAADSSGEGSPAVSAATKVVPAAGPPHISGFAPAAAITGAQLTIEGSGLAGATQVMIGKLPANFTVLSASAIEATIPNGAAAGKITVTTPSGSAKSPTKFTPSLSITRVNPASGAPGKVVTIKGLGFNSSSSVSFAGSPAVSVTSISSSKLKATVPAGAQSGTVTVTNTSAPTGTVSSPSAFTVS